MTDVPITHAAAAKLKLLIEDDWSGRIITEACAAMRTLEREVNVLRQAAWLANARAEIEKLNRVSGLGSRVSGLESKVQSQSQGAR